MNHSKSYASYSNNAKAINNGRKKNYKNKGYSGYIGHSIDNQGEEIECPFENQAENENEEYFHEQDSNYRNSRYSTGTKKRNYNENGRRSYNKFNNNGYPPLTVETKAENEIWDYVFDNKPEQNAPVAAVKKVEGKVVVSIDPKKKSLKDMFNN